MSVIEDSPSCINMSLGIKGYVDDAINPKVKGWVSSTEIDDPLMVQITKGKEQINILADKDREDVYTAGLSKNKKCGYEAQFSEDNFAVASVRAYALSDELQLAVPEYRGRKGFFIHIPKTAGSSLNEMFKQSYGEDNFYSHIEGIRDQWDTVARNAFMLSGHVGYNLYEEFFGDQNRILITFLREPYKQLISHFYWVRHLSEPEKKDFLNNHSPLVQKISKRLFESDLSTEVGLKEYVDSMTPQEHRLFNNFQTRFLVNPVKVSKILPLHYIKAVQTLGKIDIVGIVENMDESMKLLTPFLNKDMLEIVDKKEIRAVKRNVNPYDYGIDIGNELIREILHPLVRFDLDLYKKALEKNRSLLCLTESI